MPNRYTLLEELAQGKDSDTPSSSLVEMRKGFDAKYAVFEEEHAGLLAPLVNTAVNGLDGGARAAAEREEEEEPEDDYDPTEEGDVLDSTDDEAPAPSVSSLGKRKEADGSSSSRSASWHDVNKIRISIPSSYSQRLRNHPSLLPAIQIEDRIRRQQAASQLDELRSNLLISYALVRHKKGVTGQKAKTRSNTAVRRKYKAIWTCARAYRRSRKALLRLGLPPNDKKFQPLPRKAVKPFIVHTDDDVRRDKKKAPSWIWEDLSFVTSLADDNSNTVYNEYVKEGEWLIHRLVAKWLGLTVGYSGPCSLVQDPCLGHALG